MRVTTNRAVQALLLGLLLLLPASYAQEQVNIAKVQQAAEQGNADAQSLLGLMYHEGKGVPQDHKQAFAWSRKAAEQGNADAQSLLGLMYFKGQGVPQDYKQAVAWFRKAAEQGEAKAQHNFGAMYYYGQVVPQDYLQAYVWFSVAAANGAPGSQEDRDAVATRLSPEQLERAQKTAAEYFEKYQAKTSKNR